MTDILQIYYLGEETNSVKYKLYSSSGSFSGMSFHVAVKKTIVIMKKVVLFVQVLISCLMEFYC
jgi:hypothetical protein